VATPEDLSILADRPSQELEPVLVGHDDLDTEHSESSSPVGPY